MENITVTVLEENCILWQFGFTDMDKAEECFADMVKLHDGGESYEEDMGVYLDDGYFASTKITICISHPMEYVKTEHVKEEVTV